MQTLKVNDMKNVLFLFLVLSLCIASTKAEPINDKAFAKHFENFKKELKANKSAALDGEILVNYDTSPVRKLDCEEQMKRALEFSTAFDDDWKSIIKLSKKNNYKYGKVMPNADKSNAYDYWEICQVDRQYAQSEYGVIIAYMLIHHVRDQSGYQRSDFCVFSEIEIFQNRLWGIIGFDTITD